MKQTLKIALFFGIFITGIGILAIYWTFYRPLPDYDSTMSLQSVRQPVTIKTDDFGIPHIYAQNKHDLYLSLGYVQARDRLWQMTVSQMATQGRFAEFFGKKLVPFDEFQRTIGFWRIAQKMEQQLPDSTRAMLQAYADGVNQYEQTHSKDLPMQFALAGMRPIKWTPTHSLAIARLIAWQLNISWKTELNYNILLQKLGAAKFKALFPNPYIASTLPQPNATDTSTATKMSQILDHTRQYDQFMHTSGTHTGSNAWAVDGSKTNTAKPLLAGDPHLALSIPGTWYEVHLNLNGKNLSGATLPGTPSVVMGQNDVLAWSLTSLMLDDTDFFEERKNPTDPNQYLSDSLNGKAVYKSFITQHSVIKVKDDDDQRFTRKSTERGPVISDIYPNSRLVNGKCISMEWTGQQPGHELEALQQMGWAQSMASFIKGVKKFKNPAQNIIYADTVGNIARFTAAEVPVRDGNPVALRRGWKPKMQWQRMLNYDELPQIINPEKGWVANANNPIGGPKFDHYLSIYWQPNARYKRIKSYLTRNNQLGTEAFQIMQNDTYSSYAKTMTSMILPLLKQGTDSTFSVPIKYLSNWSYTYKKGETAASIMDEFVLTLSRNTLQDEMGTRSYRNFIGYSGQPMRIMLRMMQDSSATFFDNEKTPQKETKAAIIRLSMRQTLHFLERNFGQNPADWHWQNLHTLTLKPQLFGRAAEDSSASSIVKIIVNNVFSRGPYPAVGNGLTINNGEYSWNDPFGMTVGPSIRRIIDFSDTRMSLSIIPGGESGNPLSDFYNDQTERWLDGRYKILYQDSSLIKKSEPMRLLPIK